MKKPSSLLFVLALSWLTVAAADAAPAAWHWWISKVDGSRVCLQTSPGDGWVYGRGPYRDSRCTQAARP